MDFKLMIRNQIVLMIYHWWRHIS